MSLPDGVAIEEVHDLDAVWSELRELSLELYAYH